MIDACAELGLQRGQGAFAAAGDGASALRVASWERSPASAPRATMPTNPFELARTRSRVALELRARTNPRLASAQARVAAALARLRATRDVARKSLEVLARAAPELAEVEVDRLVPATRPTMSALDDRQALENVIDLVEFRWRRESQATVSRDSVEVLLAALLWDLGPNAQPLVEAILARLAQDDDACVRADIERMRTWLERHRL